MLKYFAKKFKNMGKRAKKKKAIQEKAKKPRKSKKKLKNHMQAVGPGFQPATQPPSHPPTQQSSKFFQAKKKDIDLKISGYDNRGPLRSFMKPNLTWHL